MPQAWTDNDVLKGNSQDTQEKWVHGLLRPMLVSWWRWKREGEDKASEISHDEYEALRDAGGRVQGGGERITIEVDPAHINPKLDKLWSFASMRGFQDWLGIIAPSINAVTGLNGNEAIREFRRRASTEKWYVECKVITTKRKDDPTKLNYTPEFTRMTQDLAVCKAWASERFGVTKPGEVPDEILVEARTVFTRVCKSDVSRFEAKLQAEGYESLRPFAAQLLEMAQTGKLA